MPDNLANPVLIFGCRRSGTTLLRSILAAHPNLLVHPLEPQFILTILARFGPNLRRKSKAIAALLAHPYLPDTIDRSSLAAALAQPSVQTWARFIHTYLDVWASETGNQGRIVLKDPEFTFHLEALHSLFPQASFIHVVRHPYGNVSSQRARWPQASVWECATRWRQAVTIGRRLAQSQPRHCLEVDYQKLVLGPEATLRRLCRFLDIPFTRQMLHFELDTVSFAPDRPPQTERVTELDAQRLERWRDYLTPLDVRLIERCCEQEMAWWQYEPLNPSVSAAALHRRLIRERLHYLILVNGRGLKRHLRRLKWSVMP